MSNLWFNIRMGTRHLQLTNTWKLSFDVNDYYIKNPPKKWFVIYCLFGKHL